jgi:hypothetical protein
LVYFDHHHGLRKPKSLENSFYGLRTSVEQITVLPVDELAAIFASAQRAARNHK